MPTLGLAERKRRDKIPAASLWRLGVCLQNHVEWRLGSFPYLAEPTIANGR
jgi:hypothetical protein